VGSDVNPLQRISKAFLYVSLFVLLGKLAGAIKEVVVAWKYGVSAEVDSYVLIFNYVSFPISITLSVVSVTLIPLLMQNRKSTDQFKAEFFGAIIIYSLIMWGVCYLIIDYILDVTLYQGVVYQSAKSSLLLMSTIIPVSCISVLFSVLLMSRERHVNTVLESIPPLVICLVIVVFSQYFNDALISGTVIGFMIQAIILFYLCSRNESLIPRFHMKQGHLWQQWSSSIGIVLIGQILMSTLGIIDQYYVSYLDVGSVSTLSYASKLTAILLGLVATAINRSTLPVLSDLKVQSTKILLKLIMFKWCSIVFALGILFILLVSIFSELIVSTIFERGAFTSQNVAMVADNFRILVWQSPFHFVYLFISTYLVAIREYGKVAICSIACVAAKLFYCIAFGANDIQSVALSTVFSYLVCFFIMVFFLQKKLKSLK
jgi:putative peptidoglycan lipid II flippase